MLFSVDDHLQFSSKDLRASGRWVFSFITIVMTAGYYYKQKNHLSHNFEDNFVVGERRRRGGRRGRGKGGRGGGREEEEGREKEGLNTRR